MSPDSELLRQYAEHSDQAAFAEVVHRQVGLVYSVALRVVNGDTHLAEDVTQLVFQKLARHASLLQTLPTIIGWLHTTARHTAIKAIRSEQRRRVREHEASIMQKSNNTEVNWEQLRPFLDEAVGTLDEQGRNAVLLRYFQNLSHRDVGAVLGLSEDAARKRVDRSLDKLRVHFSRRGVVVSATLLAEAMGANSVLAVPIGVADRISDASLVNFTTGGIGALLLKITLMSTKTKIIMVLAIVLAIFATIMLGLERSRISLDRAAPVPVIASQPVTWTSVEAPVVAAVAPALASAVATPAPVVTKVGTYNHQEINALISDTIAQIQEGNVLTIFNDYVMPDSNSKMPAKQRKTLEDALQSMRGTPQLKIWTEVLQTMKNQTPTYDNGGDRAIYKVSDPTGGGVKMQPVVLWRINGQWYYTSTDVLRAATGFGLPINSSGSQ